jgi:hypothetical protein
MKALLLWLQQPTSVAGLSAIAGTLAALALHQIDAAHAAPLIAASIVSIVLPDNAGARSAADTLTRDLLTKFVSKQEKT